MDIVSANGESLYPYYEIREIVNTTEDGHTITKFVAIVTIEAIAKDFCKRHNNCLYETYYYKTPSVVSTYTVSTGCIHTIG